MMPHKGSADGQELARHLPIMVFAIAFSCPAARSPNANRKAPSFSPAAWGLFTSSDTA
jgi:hypothetical protein